MTIHGKDRDPLETVKIIKNFFENAGYTIYERWGEQWVVSNIYSCSIILYKDDILTLRSNGKGLSKELALASGYGELYERYANLILILPGGITYNQYIQLNIKKYGYHLGEDERQMSYNDFTNDIRIKELLNNYFTNEEMKKDFIDFLFPEGYYGVPFTNIINKQQIFLNPKLINLYTGSTGLSAGNSFKEAFVQGFSEILERFCINKVVSDPDNSYFELTDKAINNNNLLNIIHQIRNKNNNLKIIDLSYNYNLPVILGILYSNKTQNVRFTFGCHPDFNIALERVLTELFQNINIDTLDCPEVCSLNIPLKNIHNTQLFQDLYQGYPQQIHLETFNNLLIPIEEYNKNNFISFIDLNDINYNNYVYNFMKNLINKNNYQVLIRNNSIIPEIQALQIYCPELQQFFSSQGHYIKDSTLKAQQYYLADAKIIKQSFIDKNTDQLIKLINKYLNNPLGSYIIYIYFTGVLQLIPIECTIDNAHKEQILNSLCALYENNNLSFEELDLINRAFIGTPYYWNIKLALDLYQYKQANYSFEEIKSIYKNFNIDIDENIYYNINNGKFIIDNFIFKKFEKIFSLEGMENLMKGYFLK